MLAFLATMLGLLIVSIWLDRWSVAGTLAVLLTNWCVQVAVIEVTGEQFPWLIFVVVDYLSAIAIIAFWSTRWQLGAAAIYALQIVCHAAFVLSSRSDPARLHYWWALTLTGWAQLAIAGGWLIHGMVGRGARADRGAPPGDAGVGSLASKEGRP